MKCELCARRSRRRLCPPCAEMIARLTHLWPQLDVISRGRLYLFQLEEQKLHAKAAAMGRK